MAPLVDALRALWRVVRVVVHVLHGMAVMALRFPSLDDAGRHARIAWWSAGLLRAIGVGLQIRGTPRLVKSSGLPAWDQAALRALQKTERLPRDIDGRVPPALIVQLKPKR